MRTGEQMPGETRTGQGNDSQHFTNTNCYHFSGHYLTGLTVKSQGISLWRLEDDASSQNWPRPAQARVISSPRRHSADCRLPWPRLAGAAHSTGRTGELGDQISTWPRVLVTWTHSQQAGLVWAALLCRGNTDPALIHAQTHLSAVSLAPYERATVLVHAACLKLLL